MCVLRSAVLQFGAEGGDAADIIRCRATAAADQARARRVPRAHEVAVRRRAAMPCLRHGIVRFTGVRINDDGLCRMLTDLADEARHMLGGRAVDADGRDLGLFVEQPRAVGNRIAAAGMRVIPARKGDPSHSLRMAAQVGEDGARLVEQRQRLAGQKIRLRRTEEREALRMEIRELRAARLVVAALLRAVGKIRAVGADRGGDERLRPISPRRRLLPERIACPLHEADRARDEFFGLVA